MHCKQGLGLWHFLPCPTCIASFKSAKNFFSKSSKAPFAVTWGVMAQPKLWSCHLSDITTSCILTAAMVSPLWTCWFSSIVGRCKSWQSYGDEKGEKPSLGRKPLFKANDRFFISTQNSGNGCQEYFLFLKLLNTHFCFLQNSLLSVSEVNITWFVVFFNPYKPLRKKEQTNW